MEACYGEQAGLQYRSKQVQTNPNTMQKPEVEYLCLKRELSPEDSGMQKNVQFGWFSTVN